MQALSILVLQSLELFGALLLLNYTAKPGYRFSIFIGGQLSTRRNWLLASAISFGFLVLLVFLTSLVADLLIGPKVGLMNSSAFAMLLSVFVALNVMCYKLIIFG